MMGNKTKKFWKRWTRGKIPREKLTFRERVRLLLDKIPLRKPDIARRWTTLYYGERGGGKTLHQAKEFVVVLAWLKELYTRKPTLRKAIVITNQTIAKKVKEKYPELLYFWKEIDDLQFCPRKKCWKGKHKHALHGAYVIFDDVSIILDQRNWTLTPDWLKKYFFLGRHFGIHILASLVDPLAVDISFRRCVDVAYQFTKIWGNPDPDETQPAIKRIFGIYRRRKVDAKTLWRQGDLPEQVIRLQLIQKQELAEQLKEQDKEEDIIHDDNWRGSYHLFNRTGKFWPFGYIFRPIASTEIYDTLQEVKEFTPKGFIANDLRCIDPAHVHLWDFPDGSLSETEIDEIKKRPNFCKYTKRSYEIV